VEFDLLHGDGENPWGVTTMLSAAEVRDGVCTYEYSRTLSQKLANPEVYLLINLGMQKQFNSGYGLALWENCLRFKGTGSTGWVTVEKWRKLLGADAASYEEFKRFNGEVIKPAVLEVNSVSNIIIEPEYFRERRKITKIKFTVRENPQRSLNEEIDAIGGEEVRGSETYKRLRALGIADRLAMAWLQEDPERVKAVVTIVEEQKKRKPAEVKNSGGLFRHIYENGDVVDVEVNDKAEAAAPATASDNTPPAQLEIVLPSLFTESELDRMVEEFLADGGTALSYGNGKFKKVHEKLQFNEWMAKAKGIKKWKVQD
jgi:hypothetical protein